VAIAISLAEAGFDVFATGRNIDAGGMPESVHCVRCDHTQDQQTDELFQRVASKDGSLEVAVNCAWGGYEKMVEDGKFTWTVPFWEQPAHRWTNMMDAGVRAAYVCSARAAKMMLPEKRGLIVNISFWAAQKHVGNTIYGISKAATDKMTADMAHELRSHRITVVSLYPGLVRTESVLAAAEQGWLNLANSESPEFVGRVVAGLAADPDVLSRSGKVLVAAAVAREYGIKDVDGQSPTPLTLESI
jgi:dehydrogenase/reductase SDR family protein 1